MLKFSKTYRQADCLIEITSCRLDGIALKTKKKMTIERRKRRKILDEVEPVENKNKNPQSHQESYMS